MPLVYKLCGRAAWDRCVAEGALPMSEVDAQDGFVHLSSAEQVVQTASLHFAGRTDLWLLAIEAATVAEHLRWEPSRGGALFPHLHAPLLRGMITHAAALEVDEHGALSWPSWAQPAAGGTESTRTPEAPAKP